MRVRLLITIVYLCTYAIGAIREYNGFTGAAGRTRSFISENVENSTDDFHNALMGYDVVFFRNNTATRPGLLHCVCLFA